jgi:glycosyltransferase involved in cell wall biosynthesis
MLSVSALIPARNRERYIGNAVDSVLRQERRVDEIIVVDDGSTDQTASVASSFPQVQLIALQESRGSAGARNAAIAAARGDLLAWLDSDDVWLPNHTSTAVAMLERHPTAVVGFSNAEYFGEREGPWPRVSVPQDEPFDALAFAFRRTISTMSPAITRRETVLSIGGFDESLPSAVDFDLFLRLSLKGPFVSTSRITTRYRWHGDQTSARPNEQLESMYASRLTLLRALDSSDDKGIATELRKRLLDCVHADLWGAWDQNDSASLRGILALAEKLASDAEIAPPFSSRSLKSLRKFSKDRGELQGRHLCSPQAPRLFGRPRWLYRRAMTSEIRYRWARLTAAREAWLESFIEAANDWGRVRGARG